MAQHDHLTLSILPGSNTFDLPSLDLDSFIASSYLRLYHNNYSITYILDGHSLPSYSLSTSPSTSLSTSTLLSFLQQSHHIPPESPSAKAFHSLLNTALRPLILHSLFSLPKNWVFVRALLAEPLPYPQKFYVPNQVRESAKNLVTDEWWGLGGEIEKEEEDERRRKRNLLEGKSLQVEAGAKEDGREKVRKTFGVNKISIEARRILTVLETTLSQSSTPFFFSSPSPAPFDAHISSLLSLVLFLPLPQPILSDLINSSFNRLWTHTILLRRTLFSTSLTPIPSPPTTNLDLLKILYRDFCPSFSSFPLLYPSSSEKTKQKPKKQDLEFQKKRRWFFGAVLATMVVWSLSTGFVTLPGFGSEDGEGEGNEEWRFVEGEEEEEEEEEE